MHRPPSLQVTALRKSYLEGGRSHVVLDGVDLTLQPGERVAVLGASGSGKSTILNLVSGIDRADSGEISVGGVRVDQLTEHERTIFRRERIGFVFQAYNLIHTLTVLENLLLPLELKGPLLSREVDRARALLDDVGLLDRADAFPDRLSGGERQRIAVARSLVHEPTLILADEPTGSLDEERGERIVDLLEQMTKSGDGSLLLVTHSNDLASRMDRIVRLTHGRLLENSE
ncbi:MAG: ABC transporter ATP-binding protein [Gemmatimonadales bacterium]|jgi:putative ABC transport system ATP-binding protein|nr:ABC transporter ATP-binding protein [Gemmatimonadales bacterium]MDG2239313.1 ABC transporter ATP-binding protein [Longimicrobiales bacterium]NCG32596.1 ATP-binding cassette domain-containing protein [Pseudomonadota bacterium]MBT3497527.1 ABC transporter ATP-binding protein [Gemmatimonadales bacterium]MBT3774878.1 ABC transporter ATP-binding protein [Gemmatimonadales bacterium]